ncbi:hypothetical protein NPIL_341051 [Nephila pilipes]|uniref:Uncharacterized protein n=1 Tax=Nephila pilipes TaxID=299642 RepID=A0A8X6QFS2_NEPPI|nr:hypothetical protein NPIL_341051 [Nephila pilipes]
MKLTPYKIVNFLRRILCFFIARFNKEYEYIFQSDQYYDETSVERGDLYVKHLVENVTIDRADKYDPFISNDLLNTKFISQNSQLTGLKTLRSVGKSALIETGDNILISANLGAGPICFKIFTSVGLGHFKKELTVELNLTYVQVLINFNVFKETGRNGDLVNFLITELSGFKCFIRGLYYMDPFINLFLAIITVLSKRLIRNLLENELYKYLDDMLPKFQFPVEGKYIESHHSESVNISREPDDENNKITGEMSRKSSNTKNNLESTRKINGCTAERGNFGSVAEKTADKERMVQLSLKKFSFSKNFLQSACNYFFRLISVHISFLRKPISNMRGRFLQSSFLAVILVFCACIHQSVCFLDDDDENIARGDKFIDDLLHDMLEENGHEYDPYRLEDSVIGFSKKITFVNVSGEAKLHNGYITGLKSLHRPDHCSVEDEDGKLLVKADLGAGVLDFHYDGTVKFMNFGPTITLHATLAYLEVHMEFTVDSKTGRDGELKKFVIDDMKGMKMSITGLGPMNWAANYIIGGATSLFKGFLKSFMQKKVREHISERLPRYQFPIEGGNIEITVPDITITSEEITTETDAPEEIVPEETEAPEEIVPDETEAPEEIIPDETEAPEEIVPDETEAPEEIVPDETEAPEETEAPKDEALEALQLFSYLI